MNTGGERILEKANMLEIKINKKLSNLHLSFKTYLEFIILVFFITGSGLFVVCFIGGYNPLLIVAYQSPFFYWMLGFAILLFRIWEGKTPTKFK